MTAEQMKDENQVAVCADPHFSMKMASATNSGPLSLQAPAVPSDSPTTTLVVFTRFPSLPPEVSKFHLPSNYRSLSTRASSPNSKVYSFCSKDLLDQENTDSQFLNRSAFESGSTLWMSLELSNSKGSPNNFDCTRMIAILVPLTRPGDTAILILRLSLVLAKNPVPKH